jgi:hypothetical protein
MSYARGIDEWVVKLAVSKRWRHTSVWEKGGEKREEALAPGVFIAGGERGVAVGPPVGNGKPTAAGLAGT